MERWAGLGSLSQEGATFTGLSCLSLKSWTHCVWARDIIHHYGKEDIWIDYCTGNFEGRETAPDEKYSRLDRRGTSSKFSWR